MDRDRILRIIDANLNRSREALRSLEEAARLGMDDARVASRLKDLRHGLREYEATLGLRPGDLASFRDPEGDVGRCAPAAPYGAVEELATANARRLSEALRVLEEYGRLFGKGSETASRIRFEAYALEKVLVPGIRTRTALNSARLYFILNADLPDKDPFALARASLLGGADVVQLRAFPGPDSERLALARRLKKLCEGSGALFLENDRADLAMACDADGVHLGQEDIPVVEARKIVGLGRLIGLSTHSIEELSRIEGADYVGIGTVFASPVKPERELLGAAATASLFRQCPVPAFAIGGVYTGNIHKLTRKGVYRVAVSSGIAQAPDPEIAARRLKEAVSNVKPV